jgi:hypothetical protein
VAAVHLVVAYHSQRLDYFHHNVTHLLFESSPSTSWSFTTSCSISSLTRVFCLPLPLLLWDAFETLYYRWFAKYPYCDCDLSPRFWGYLVILKVRKSRLFDHYLGDTYSPTSREQFMTLGLYPQFLFLLLNYCR